MEAVCTRAIPCLRLLCNFKRIILNSRAFFVIISFFYIYLQPVKARVAAKHNTLKNHEAHARS